MTLTGLVVSKTVVYLLEVGLATSTFSNSQWRPHMRFFQSPHRGWLRWPWWIREFLRRDRGLRRDCILGIYSSALGFQTLARWIKQIPRWVLTCLSAAISTACALGGRNVLLKILQQIVTLLGYWVTIFLSIVLEEHLLFTWNKPFDWTAWSG